MATNSCFEVRAGSAQKIFFWITIGFLGFTELLIAAVLALLIPISINLWYDYSGSLWCFAYIPLFLYIVYSVGYGIRKCWKSLQIVLHIDGDVLTFQGEHFHNSELALVQCSRGWYTLRMGERIVCHLTDRFEGMAELRAWFKGNARYRG